MNFPLTNCFDELLKLATFWNVFRLIDNMFWEVRPRLSPTLNINISNISNTNISNILPFSSDHNSNTSLCFDFIIVWKNVDQRIYTIAGD